MTYYFLYAQLAYGILSGSFLIPFFHWNDTVIQKKGGLFHNSHNKKDLNRPNLPSSTAAVDVSGLTFTFFFRSL